MAIADFHNDLDRVVERYLAGTFATEIAEEYGISHQTVTKHLRRRGVEIRRRGHGINGATWRKMTFEQEDEAAAAYRAGATNSQLAERYGMTRSGMRWALKRKGVVMRPGGARRNDKLERRYTTHGYVHVRVEPDDQLASPMYKNDFTPEHRYVMAKHLGRRLADHETVHHKNGVRDDNRLENLQLRQGAHGRGAAFRCETCGSRNVVAIKLHDERV